MRHCALCQRPLPAGKKRFCCTKHKDRYHNIHNPRGKFAHLNPTESEKRVCDMRDAEHGEWDHGDCGIY